MIGTKNSYEIDSVGHPIVFFFNIYHIQPEVQPSHIGYFSWDYLPLKW